jgi:hypothetical protein
MDGWRSVLAAAVLPAVASCAPSLDKSSDVAPSPQRAAIALATPAVTAYVGPPRGRGAMPGVRATRKTKSLAAAGLDVANLPPLETLRPGPKQRVMRTFSEALGVPCVGCHAADGDFTADTRRKRVARRMWDEIVRVVKLSDGSPIYCDSCHDGALFHLDRRDPKGLSSYMCDTMVGGLERTDGRPHDCTTCHGDPPDLHLLTTWKATPAPVIVDVCATFGSACLVSHKASTPASRSEATPLITPQWPIEGPREPRDCGPQGASCPLAAWMRLVVAPAFAKQDPAELWSALDRVAKFAPENAPFVAAAKTASEAVLLGDWVAVRSACGACHAEHKAAWRATSRTRAPQ